MKKKRMRNREVKKTGFLEGTVIATVAILFTKLIGALYSIPFYAIIGETGGVIYSCAYNIYNLFLSISTSGIPTAMSILISRYAAAGRERSKQRAYRVGRRMIMGISFVCFLILFLFAEPIGSFLITNREGGVHPADVAGAVRTVSLCLLIVPFVSVRRGYLQGHKVVAVSSTSQVIEQLVRVFVILAGSFIAMRVLGFGAGVGVCVALFGAFLGAVAALWYMESAISSRRELFVSPNTGRREAHPDSTGKILRRFMAYCVPVILVSVTTDIYNITDMKLVLTGLAGLGYDPAVSETIASVIATWAPKICMMITALALGMSSSLIPHMADSYVHKDQKGLSRKFARAVNTVLIVAIPLGAAMGMLAPEVYAAFYGPSDYGPDLLRLISVVNVLYSINMVVNMSLQSIGKPFAVCGATVTGAMINALLDLPLIRLFAVWGLPAYLGAPAASIVGQMISLGIALVTLKRKTRFSLKPIFRMILRLVIPLGAMLGTIALIRLVLPHYTGYPTLLLTLLLHFVAGGSVYLLLCRLTGALKSVFGNRLGQTVLSRLGRG